MNTQNRSKPGVQQQGTLQANTAQQQQAQSQFQSVQAPADPLVAGVSEDVRQVAQLGYN